MRPSKRLKKEKIKLKSKSPKKTKKKEKEETKEKSTKKEEKPVEEKKPSEVADQNQPLPNDQPNATLPAFPDNPFVVDLTTPQKVEIDLRWYFLKLGLKTFIK